MVRTGSNHNAIAVHSIARRRHTSASNSTDPARSRAISRSDNRTSHHRQTTETICQPNLTTTHGIHDNARKAMAAKGG